jgi:hypothetical protein
VHYRAALWILISVLVLAAATPVSARSRLPPPVLCSQETASRWFDAVEGSGTLLAALQAGVVQYESADNASSAISPWFESVREFDEGSWGLEGLQPVVVETLADETRAMAGTIVALEDETISYEVAVLAVRVDDILHTFVGWADYSNPLDTILDVAKRTLGIEPLEFDPVPDIPYRTDGLFELLPRLEHLPGGMAWGSDWSNCRTAETNAAYDELAGRQGAGRGSPTMSD